MMNLKMDVYSPNLELLGTLQNGRSIIWEEKAFGAGAFSFESLITDESKKFLIPDNIIWIEGETAGIIEYIQEEVGDSGPYITIKGRLLTGILDRRILWGLYDLSGPVPEIMRYLVDDCCINPTRGNTEARIIPGLVLDTTTANGGISIRIQRTGGNLLEVLEELGAAYNVAFGIRFNPEVSRMEFWARPGVNRSVNQTETEPVFYSTELDDVLSSEYSYDSSGYRNIALVAGEGEGTDRVYVTVEAEGEPIQYEVVGFVAYGDTTAMLTAEGQEINVLSVSSVTAYQSKYTGEQIDKAIQIALSGGTGGGVTMEQVNAAIRAAILDSWGASY